MDTPTSADAAWVEETVTFVSSGARVAGTLRRPPGPGPFPAVVQGPGWLGLRDAVLYVPYHEALVGAGFAVLIIDYRGFGTSDPLPVVLSPEAQVDDLVAAVTYLAERDDIDLDRIGVFGSGGTGGGHAVVLAARDRRVRCAVAQVPVADGEDWLRRMRSSSEEWASFLERVDHDRILRASGGRGEWVHPRQEIMVPVAERKATTVKADVDGRVPTRVPLAVVGELLAYRPADHASDVSGLLVVAVEGDRVTPTDHAEELYERSRPPKKLIVQYGTGHYEAYRKYGSRVIPEIVEWFRSHIGGPVGSAADIMEVRE